MNRMSILDRMAGGPTWAVFAALLLLASVHAGCGGGEGGKEKNGGEDKPAGIDFDKKWDAIFSDGEEGKFWCDQGFGHLRDAAGPQAKDEAYREIIKGFKIMGDAIERGETLKDAAETQYPGRAFPEWEKALAKWGRLRFKVRKDVPLEYFKD